MKQFLCPAYNFYEAELFFLSGISIEYHFVQIFKQELRVSSGFGGVVLR